MIIPNNTQILTDEGKLAIATKEQEGTIVATGGASDITCLVDDGSGNKDLAVKVVSVDGESVADSSTNPQVLTDGNELAVATLGQDGNVLTGHSATDKTCLVETETGKQTALKTFALDGTLLASDGSSNTTCIVQDGDGNKQLALKVFGSSADWKGKPADWSDIRKDCPANSIALYAGHTADYSSYDNLGFTATCTGGYKVYIDGNVYGSYSSGSTCNITWSSLALDTGDDITTPRALKAHKIWIEPATEGENITAFVCKRVAASGMEEQGILWFHFNISNAITIANLYRSGGVYTNYPYAITAKNNKLIFAGSLYMGIYAENPFQYAPVLEQNSNNATNLQYNFISPSSNLKSIVIKNCKPSSLQNSFGNLPALTKCNISEWDFSGCSYIRFLKATSLNIGTLDLRNDTVCKKVELNGDSSNFVAGLKGLRVSNEAPFDATAPQINVQYTGMDRAALVQLFNDLPTVSAGQIINITGATGSEDLTEEEVEIAENKGWTTTGGPQFADLYAYTDGNNNTIYSTDNLPTTSSELFNSTGTKLTGNPTAVTQGIINLSNYNNNVNITDGVASGFGLYKSLKTTSAFNPSNKPWSWVFKIKTPSSVSSRKLFVGARQSYYQAGFGAELTAEGKIFCGFTNGGAYDSGWKIGSITEPTVVDTSSWYYVKPYFTGTKYQLAIKKEGDSTWSEGGTAIESTTAINSNGVTLQIGAEVANGSGWNYPFSDGSIDLKETYSEIDGVKKHYYTSTLTYNDVIYTRDYDKDILR